MTSLSLDRLKTVFRGNNGDAPETPPKNPANLYECANCETVYIADEMESCPECETGVTAVPNEHELGLDLGR